MPKPIAFIDLENVGNLNKVNLSLYAHAVIFVGPTQKHIHCGVGHDHPLPITLIKIQQRQRNNLDFHLAYYLGLYDQCFCRYRCFEVISSDNGFAPLIEHVGNNGRQCKQVTLKCELAAQQSISAA